MSPLSTPSQQGYHVQTVQPLTFILQLPNSSVRSETCNSWTSYLIIEEINTISNTLGAPCKSVDKDQQSSVIIT